MCHRGCPRGHQGVMVGSQGCLRVSLGWDGGIKGVLLVGHWGVTVGSQGCLGVSLGWAGVLQTQRADGLAAPM